MNFTLTLDYCVRCKAPAAGDEICYPNYLCTPCDTTYQEFLAQRSFDCILCGGSFPGFGNNASPLANGNCCNRCNHQVIQARFHHMQNFNNQNKP